MFEKLQKNIGEALDLPADVLGDSPKITIVGRQEIIVENYQEIIMFTEGEICLDTAEGLLRLYGQNFLLKSILPAELKIEGELKSLAYDGRSNS